MKPDVFSARRLALPALALCALALGACSSASLVSPGEDPLGGFEQRLIGNTLAGIGLVPSRAERINYEPRAPLAMPPINARAQLPPPEDPNQVAANQPNWPRDPDVLRREALARENSDPHQRFEQDRNSYRRLSPEEMEALKNAGPNGTQVASADPQRRYPEHNVVLGREELERGWEQAPGGDGLFQVDETVDVAAQNEEKRKGPARVELDANAGAPGVNSTNASRRIDTTRLASAPVPERRSITDPPSELREPAQDPTNGVVNQDDRNWFEKMFSR